VRGGELFETASAGRREADPHDALVEIVGHAAHEVGPFGAVHEFDHAVVAGKQVPSDVTNGRPTRVVMTTDGEQQLVLRRSDARRRRRFLAPTQELPQSSTERKEALVVGIAKLAHENVS